MAIPKFEDDLRIISKLGDNPGTDNGYTTEEFKEAFDKAPLLIQKFINEVLIPAANASSSPEEGLSMKGPINMNGQKLVGIAAPEEDDDAVNYGTLKKVDRIEKTLTAAGWTASDTAGFVQSVVVDGLTDDKKVRVYPAIPTTLAEKLALAEETPKVKACTRTGNTMTFEAWEETPALDIPIIVEVVA